jgi:hypothetical protein
MAEKYNLDDYETVDLRLRRLYTSHPEARVLTDMVYRDDRSFIVKAELYLDRNDLTPVSTGYAEEIVGAGFVNKTSALENCETSAIGRAISNSPLVLGTPEGKRPSQSEMEKVERYKESPRKTVTKKIDYTPEQLADAEILINSSRGIADINDLREIWTLNTPLLDVPINGTTLKDVINSRVKELSA